MKVIKLFAFTLFSAMVMSFYLPVIKKGAIEKAFARIEKDGLVWKNEVIDLGNIPQNKPVKVEFGFTNKGNSAVIINQVTTSCGCTAADYARAPVSVNESSSITVTYNAASLGAFSKAITVTFADNDSKVLYIKGTVIQ